MALQLQALIKHGVPENRIFQEHASGKSMKRAVLQRTLKVMREGDTLCVWKLDRLGRDLSGVLEMIKKLDVDGIELVSLTEAFDTKTPMGKAFMQIALVFAELERNMISERTKAGMAVKMAEGTRFGRAHTIRDNTKRITAMRKLDEAGQLRSEDDKMLMTARAVMEALNKADLKAKPINNPETVRRWWREGFPGLAETPST